MDGKIDNLLEAPEVRKTGGVLRVDLHFPKFNKMLVYDPLEELTYSIDDNPDSVFDDFNKFFDDENASSTGAVSVSTALTLVIMAVLSAIHIM